jgi:CBS domain-containing protein
MLVREAMTRDVHIASPDQTILEAAKMMADMNIGCLPVGDEDRLVGMITDRDIVVRGVAQGRDGRSLVGEVMTKGIKYCFEDEDMDEVLVNMSEVKIRRVPVVDRHNQLVGVLSLGDAAKNHDPEAAGIALSGVAAKPQQHS